MRESWESFLFFTELALWPLWSSSRNVQPSVCLLFKKRNWGLWLALRIWQDQPDSTTIGRINQAADRWQDQPGSKPLAGSTRQQTVGRINQAADLWDGDEDEDEDKDEDEDEH